MQQGPPCKGGHQQHQEVQRWTGGRLTGGHCELRSLGSAANPWRALLDRVRRRSGLCVLRHGGAHQLRCGSRLRSRIAGVAPRTAACHVQGSSD
jgi:hypothetical protein